MRKLIVAFCDIDKAYCDRFVTYLMEYKVQEMEVHACSEPAILSEQLKQYKFDAVLAGEEFLTVREQLSECCTPVLWLTQQRPQEQPAEDLCSDCNAIREVFIFKYQPANQILHEMQVLLAGTCPVSKRRGLDSGVEVIGVCSPVRHEMQMPFSVMTALTLSQEQKVLYVNMMEYSGFSHLFSERVDCDLGDVISCLRNKRLNAQTFMRSVYELNQFSFIAPFLNEAQVEEVTANDILLLLKFVSRETPFQKVILDCEAGMPALVEVLFMCDSIYCIHKTGYFYECQIEQFLQYLQIAGGEQLKERMHIVNLPYTAKGIRNSGSILEQLQWSDFGDYVRNYFSGVDYESK